MTVPHLVPEPVRSLEPFALAGVFGLTEIHLAASLATADPGASHDVLLGAALAARAPLHGSVCVELGTVRETVVSSLLEPTEPVVVESTSTPSSDDPHDDDGEFVAAVDQAVPIPSIDDLDWPDDRWSSTLASSPLVDVVERNGRFAEQSPVGHLRPLVLDGDRLYLARYWHLERFVAADLAHRATATGCGAIVDPTATAARTSELFDLASRSDGTVPDPSQLAAATAVAEHDLVVIVGGPGTGKTTTVAHLLAGILWSRQDRSEAASTTIEDRIALVAPTGKAAARMTEAIRDAAGRLSDHLPSTVAEGLDSLEAVTIHRLLGRRGAGFRHRPDQPLPHELVIVDEVSMVSLSLMAHLLAAIPARTKLVLVGDPYQLASVEAGTVLGDVVGVSNGGDAPAAVAPAVRSLSTVHRQKAGSTILDLAAAVRIGGADEVVEILANADPAEVSWIDPTAVDPTSSAGPDDGEPGAPRRDQAGPTTTGRGGGPGGAAPEQASLFDADTYAPIAAGAGPAELATDRAEREVHRRRLHALVGEVDRSALAAVAAAADGDEDLALDLISSVKVLCALRRGPDGVDRWNRSIEDHLRNQNAIRRGDWYAGRPTMVVENDYLNRVFNGDVGVALRSRANGIEGPDAAGYRVVFRRAGGNQEIPAIRLDRVATQWAMSIHKSQGSEFRHAVVVLPPPPARILTRELLYTGITRAKERLTLVASEAALRAAVGRPVARASGLADRLS